MWIKVHLLKLLKFRRNRGNEIIFSSATRLKRKRESPSPYKKRSAEYLALQGTHPVDGPWTTHETCLLFCVTSLIGATTVTPSVENITALFNHVTDSKICKDNNYPLRRKKQSHVSTQLKILNEKQELGIGIGKCYFSILPISRGKHTLFPDSNTLRRAS